MKTSDFKKKKTHTSVIWQLSPNSHHQFMQRESNTGHRAAMYKNTLRKKKHPPKNPCDNTVHPPKQFSSKSKIYTIWGGGVNFKLSYGVLTTSLMQNAQL